MSKPYDATTKALLETRPADWLPFLGLAPDIVEVIEADVSTVTAEADKVLRVGPRSHRWLLHLEFQSSRDPDLLWRLVRYNGLLTARHRLPTWSAVILLRPDANDRRLSGKKSFAITGRKPHIRFEYEVIRVWEVSPESILQGGLAALPLITLAKVEPATLPNLVELIGRRLTREASKAERDQLWAASYLLSGLRYDDAFADQLFRGVREMRESTTWQAIYREGREEGREEGAILAIRQTLLELGRKCLGEPTAATVRKIEQLSDHLQLSALVLRVPDVETWDDLFPTESPPRTKRKKS